MGNVTTSAVTSAPLVVVVGSVNLDIVTDLDRLPRPGETLIARSVRRNVGGKGANQAVASQITCGAASFIGRVGDDADGRRLLDGLVDRGVATDLVTVVADEPSGVAYIAVADGQNTIVVATGANGAWRGLGADERAAVAAAPVVVCQLEIGESVIADTAAAVTGRFVLNAAPARPLSESVLRRCDPVVVNEHELADLTSSTVDGPGSASAAAQRLRERGAISVVATLGTRARSGRMPTERDIRPPRSSTWSTPPEPAISSWVRWPRAWRSAPVSPLRSGGRLPLRRSRCSRRAPWIRTPIAARSTLQYVTCPSLR